MAHTSEHLAVLGNIERYYASEKRGRRSIKLAGTAQTRESTPIVRAQMLREREGRKIRRIVVALVGLGFYESVFVSFS